MDRSVTSGPDASSDLLITIIETLEVCGLNRDEYQLYDTVDVEALEQILHSSSGDIKVQFTVEEIQLSVTPESVDVLINDEEPNSTEQ